MDTYNTIANDQQNYKAVIKKPYNPRGVSNNKQNQLNKTNFIASAVDFLVPAPLTTVGGRWHVTKVILRSLGLCLSCWGSAVRTRVLHVTAPIWQLFAGGTRSACERVYVLVLWCSAAAHRAAPDEL